MDERQRTASRPAAPRASMAPSLRIPACAAILTAFVFSLLTPGMAHAQDTLRFPGGTWEAYVTPEEAGWSSEKLTTAKAFYDTSGSAAFLVVHDGVVLVSWGDVSRRYMCHSVRKSFLSALIGIHAAEGRITLDKSLAALGIDDEPPLTETEKQARVIDLLNSRSGVYCARCHSGCSGFGAKRAFTRSICSLSARNSSRWDNLRSIRRLMIFP